MTQKNEQTCSCQREYNQLKVFEEYFVSQFELLPKLIEIISKNGKPERFDNLGILLVSINSNAESIVRLNNNGFINEAYIIARSYFEKSVNFCYLNVCDEDEYDNYLDWSHQKIIRALYTKKKAYKNMDQEVPLPDILSFAKECKGLLKFSGKKGGEKPNWTDASIYSRIKYIESKITDYRWRMYLASLNMIYEDASESIHGTLYGVTFHRAVFYGMKKSDEDKFKYMLGLGFTLYLLLGYLIDGICKIVSIQIPIDELIKKSRDNYNDTIQKFYNDPNNRWNDTNML